MNGIISSSQSQPKKGLIIIINDCFCSIFNGNVALLLNQMQAKDIYFDELELKTD